MTSTVLASTQAWPVPSSTPNRGVVFTRRWVVDLILDLAGYVPESDLAQQRLIEPACGQGAFLTAIVERLLDSCRRHGRDIRDARGAIEAFDIDSNAVYASREAVTGILTDHGVDPVDAADLVQAWIRHGDFLRVASSSTLTPARWVVGNPPYVRVEEADPADMATYRSLWSTMSGRADLYVGFLEAGLGLLDEGGRLAVICADRWMRNQYGASLRSVVEESYAMQCCVIMHEADAFEDRVAAYPAITVVGATSQQHAMVADTSASFGPAAAGRLAGIHRAGPAPVRSDPDFEVSWSTGWFAGTGSWPSGAPDRLAKVAALEARFPTLTEAGAHVGVGVATGADDIYLTHRTGRIEARRLLPVVSARETADGTIRWAGRYLVNPWDEDGLTRLQDYPKMAAYLRRHKKRLLGRHVGRQNPDAWWRTLDRVSPGLAATPKLLIPDLKNRIHPVLDEGRFYPSHSLYYLTAPQWDLSVLGGLLLSDIATSFVEAYSVRMANGYLRVSAQYLRRVRVPAFDDIDQPTREALRAAFEARDPVAASRAAEVAYGVTEATADRMNS